MLIGEQFFLIFLGTIAVTRIVLLSKKGSPTIRGFRLRHYMYGAVLITFSFLIHNLVVYAIGIGLLVDEIPLIFAKGPGHREEDWRGLQDYFSPWCIASVLMLVFIIYIFRNAIAALI